jgi:DNA-binding response OmpR family regulator
VRGLDSGADDYVVKPFSVSELVARLRAVMRRAHPGAAQDVLHFADVELDTAGHRVTRAGRSVHLGPTEYRLLRHLMLHPGRVFSREQLLDAVWGHDIYVEARTVDVAPSRRARREILRRLLRRVLRHTPRRRRRKRVPPLGRPGRSRIWRAIQGRAAPLPPGAQICEARTFFVIR